MGSISAAHRHVHVQSRSTSQSGEADIKAIRRAIDSGDHLKPVKPQDVPKAVAHFAAEQKKKAGARATVEVQTFTAGGQKYFQVSTAHENAGKASILDPQGHVVTGYAFDEGVANTWRASKGEATREGSLAKAASDVLRRSALGSARFAQYELKGNQIPEAERVDTSVYKLRKFYKMEIGGKPVIVDYMLYPDAGTKPKDQIGQVALLDLQGGELGEAQVYNNSPDKLTFNVNLGR